MGDVNCQCCGEPYGVYSLHHEIPEWDDQPDDAYDRFMNGEGCPTCDWGEKAGDVSLSREQDQAELDAQHLQGIMNETDDDPIRFF
jgi:hypothetical protein